MKSLGSELFQYDWCPIKRRNLDPEIDAEGKQCEDMQGEDSHVIGMVCL